MKEYDSPSYGQKLLALRSHKISMNPHFIENNRNAIQEELGIQARHHV